MNTTHEVSGRSDELSGSVDWLEVLDRVRGAVDDGFRAVGLTADETVRTAAVNPIAVRNSVIRHEFNQGRHRGQGAGAMVDRLAVEYRLSGDTIQAIVKGKR